MIDKEAIIKAVQSLSVDQRIIEPSVQPALPSATVVNVMNNMLKQLPGGLTFDNIISLRDQNVELEEKVSALNVKLRKANKGTQQIELVYTGTGGQGTLEIKPAYDVLGKGFNGSELPTYKWETPHSRVAREKEFHMDDAEIQLVKFLAEGISLGLNSYVYGPTGCGKDAAIDYVSHKTGLPIFRISCDADISRAELIGRDKLEGDGKGGTQSGMIDGILVEALKSPGILVLDEIDFMREDISYVLQTVLNEGQLTLLEKGGEVITKHPQCFIIATANTNGVSDIANLYPGARQKSAAFLDRFNHWFKADYKNSYFNMLTGITGMKKEYNDMLNKFIKDYHRMFNAGDIRTPLSNRAIITIAEKIAARGKFNPTEISRSVDTTLIARLDDIEAPRVMELMQKRFK